MHQSFLFYFSRMKVLVALSFVLALQSVGAKTSSRIVGGDDANIKDYPYQVAVIYIDTVNCGGTIISENYVLSAAHCFTSVSASDTFIRAGSSYASEGGQFCGVSAIMQHNQYNEETQDYDLSILKLDENLILGVGVQIAQLPAPGAVFEGTGVATGWGQLAENGKTPFQLQKVDIPLLSRQICDLVYGDRLTERMICAGYIEGGKDTCQGDSGGPFVVSGVLVGVTSWGDGCAAANSPGVYTQVSYFTEYINSVIH